MPGDGATEVAPQEVDARVGALLIADVTTGPADALDLEERSRAPGSEVHVHMTIVNTGDADGALVSASTPISADVLLFDSDEEMIQDGGLPVPGEATVVLSEAGPWVQVSDIAERLEPGETFELSLEFAEAGRVELEVPVTASPV